MNVAVFSTKEFEKNELEQANRGVHDVKWIEEPLNASTASHAESCQAVMVAASDDVSSIVIDRLKRLKVMYVLTRSTGHDHIDIGYAKESGLLVSNVPAYSPHAIAEFALMLMLALDRNLYQAFRRIDEHDFTLNGLTGFGLHGKTVGIIGVGAIGAALAGMLKGFGCLIMGHDITPSASVAESTGLQFVSLDKLISSADIISLHLPHNPSTRHLIDHKKIGIMKKGVMLVNTGRGALLDTSSVYEALQTGTIGRLGIDVYENERSIFSKDFSLNGMDDPLLARLIEHPHTIVTAHQAFLTQQALQTIASAVWYNINCWENGFRCRNELT